MNEQVMSTREEQVFEIRIDGKLVCAKRRGKPGVFLHMDTFVQVRTPHEAIPIPIPILIRACERIPLQTKQMSESSMCPFEGWASREYCRDRSARRQGQPSADSIP